MHLAVVIPSLHRRDKLQVCISSILRSAKSDEIDLFIYFSDKTDMEYFNQLSVISNIKLNYLGNYDVPSFWNTFLKQMTADGLFYLNDDTELFNNTLEVILEEYPKHFPTYDGLMGVCQANLDSTQALESAFGVIGRKYAQRFLNKQVFCPDFLRFFADKEMWLYAKSINKFYFCSEARINHYHPSLNHELEDETHHKVRTFLKQDKLTFQRRQAKGYLWGKDYNLINM